MAWIKNPKGRIVEVTDERKEFLLNPTPMVTGGDGKRVPYIKQACEQGFSEPTDDEIARAEKIGAAGDVNRIYGPKDFAGKGAAVPSGKGKPTGKTKSEEEDEGEDDDGDDDGKGKSGGKSAKTVPPAVRKKAEQQANEAKGDKEKWAKLSDYAKEVYEELHGTPEEWMDE